MRLTRQHISRWAVGEGKHAPYTMLGDDETRITHSTRRMCASFVVASDRGPLTFRAVDVAGWVGVEVLDGDGQVIRRVVARI